MICISNILLRVCARWGWPSAVRVLLDRGADPYDSSDDGENALHRAIAGRHPEIVDSLIHRYPGIAFTKGVCLELPLCWAYVVACVPGRRMESKSKRQRRSLESLRLLLNAGTLGVADENILLSAVTVGDLPVIRLLMSFGADPFTKGGNGECALEIAKRSDDQDVIRALTGG